MRRRRRGADEEALKEKSGKRFAMGGRFGGGQANQRVQGGPGVGVGNREREKEGSRGSERENMGEWEWDTTGGTSFAAADGVQAHVPFVEATPAQRNEWQTPGT